MSVGDHSALGLQVVGLSKSFGGVHALDAFTHRFEPGRSYGILGHNGAGKTTLLNVLSGVLTPIAGSVSPISSSRGRWWRRGIARTFQRLKLVEDLDAYQNVLLGLHPLRWRDMLREAMADLVAVPRRERSGSEMRAARALCEVGLDRGLWQVPVGALPFGLKRKVELARALARNPGLLLLDEPLSGLSPGERTDTLAILGRMTRAKRHTIVLVEHQYQAMAGISDEVLFMAQGTLARGADGEPVIGTLDAVLHHPLVRQGYLGAAIQRGHGPPRMRAARPLLEIDGLEADYRSRGTVLSRVRLSAWGGEVMLIKGLNGAGKTSLLRCIAGVGEVRIRAGSVRFDGQEIGTLPARVRARQGVIYCPQERRVFPTLSVKRHFQLVAWDLKTIATDLDGLLELFPMLREKWHQPAGLLSGGQQQMLALAMTLLRARASKTSVAVLLDEPTTGLQPSLVSTAAEAIERAKRERVAFVITEQQPALDNFADQVVMLDPLAETPC